ncbi:hypothetical protein Pse7367_3344 [Thalassoporum mexicanum PCC 7367]|uniref:hypothetical protein n=1 Tax=Thalassoporum mexicanum TaxID=3457544 RepID=UPI00029FF7C4|nr:hypothetical protein [Pseudanabaena sp. PCC 7367]AFY71584.1 hypothetical protein Pse7367_3344 [Pseudanabaena sp. PCC 7367]
MARYTQHYVIAIGQEKLKPAIVNSLEACNLAVIYVSDDYFMAREVGGKISFTKLVTVEVLVNQTEMPEDKIKLTCVTKNEELPLKLDNHCSQMAEVVGNAFKQNESWNLLEAISG